MPHGDLFFEYLDGFDFVDNAIESYFHGRYWLNEPGPARDEQPALWEENRNE
jgi:hypothetical protein